VDCGETRLIDARQFRVRCFRCSCRLNGARINALDAPRSSGKEHHFYKQGFTLNGAGYKIITLPRTHPFRKMADRNGRIREHRLIMAQHLGRFLERWEVVHHKNRNKQDNRLENLELVSKETHALITRMEQEIDQLKREIERLTCLIRKEN